MRKSKQMAIAEKFKRLSFHDDVLTSAAVWLSKKNVAMIDLSFRDYSTDKGKLLSLTNCANLRFIMDFDVLSDNWFAQTHASNAQVDLNRMKRFVMAQKGHWHTKYMPPTPSDRPIRRKLSNIRDYVLFKVTFFGGTIEVLAKNYRFTPSR